MQHTKADCRGVDLASNAHGACFEVHCRGPICRFLQMLAANLSTEIPVAEQTEHLLHTGHLLKGLCCCSLLARPESRIELNMRDWCMYVCQYCHKHMHAKA